jgi:ubiquitin C-terminal hydrolase
MPYELIIVLERGINCANRTLINFPFDLDLSNFVELSEAPKKFKLVGTVNTVEINGELHYISFTKDKTNETWICSDDDKINQTDRSTAISYGIPILLFYSFVRENH